MTKSDKILTPEYLDWHAKLSGLPSILTDKICFSLYKKYKREMGLEPLQLSEAPDENKDNDEYIYYNEEKEYDDNEDDGDEDDGDENDGDKDDGNENNGAENNGGEDEGDYNEEEDDDDDGDDEEEEEDIEEFFSSPEIGNDEVFVMESLNDSIETEIILWVFKFQQRFRLPDIALEVLIKFLHIVLTRLDKSQFKNFPASLYLAKKMLNIFQPKMQLAVCNNCHKLYNVRNIVEYKEEGKAAIANCLHEEFPDNPVPSRRNKCNNPLSILKKRKGEIIAVPRMIYPKPNTPATRKLFGHGSAVMKCHRCEKRSTYSEVYKKTHYGGMQEYDKWVTNPINPSLHRQYAHEWLQCNSKSSRDTHFKEHGVRWSELLRLPYMDPIRFAVVDPMHCLFLGIAKWIIKSIFINQNKLSMEQLRIAQKRMDYIELPSDIGRIPPKIAIGNEGFSNLTADQWKTFIMIYSTPILWDMLDNNNRKILGHFVQACN
ncbi:hypothetical protein RhiirA1_403115 [Rhizophagus irregularis]|uniref:Transposase domain-containing protein n=2 Tax=Rhizophagus irregularis TaxID=588596 RepID=A0A2N0QVP5_9GLOM|nr:hypothetical protein RhiirA1_403115 [Rhizophagus irregularis]